MKAQVDQLNHMSETLESSGFTPRQSNAVIESVALAMETFAVTPKLLEERLETHTEQILRVIRAQGETIKLQGESIKLLGTDIKDLQRAVSRLEQTSIDIQASTLDHQRSMFRIMMVFVLSLLAAVLGVFGTLVKQFLFP